MINFKLSQLNSFVFLINQTFKTSMKNPLFLFVLYCTLFGVLVSCNESDVTPDEADDEEVSVSVEPSLFLTAGLSEPITIVSRTLSDGKTADCYKIVVTSTPADHTMGPWCPTSISDDASKGGIWLDDGQVFDVDGTFVKNLAEFFGDKTWMMYNNSTGKITKTSTEKECEEAANPNVGEEYKNYCVECLPTYVANLTHTYYIPVNPKAAKTPYSFSRGGPGGPPPGGGKDRPTDQGSERPPRGEGPRPPRSSMNMIPSVRGLAFNGVVFDAPAPVDRILGAYTLAPFDDAGGHINVNQGYHYHAATGLSFSVEQSDNHAPLIGYAADGYGIYAYLDENEVEATGLDDCRGHYDDVRGYHYHVDYAGNNNFINGLHGEYAK